MSTVRTPSKSKSRPQYKGGKRVRSKSSGRGFWIVTAVVVVIAIAAVVAVASGSKNETAAAQPASAALLAKVTSVPQAVFDKVGAGTAQPLLLSLPTANPRSSTWVPSTARTVQRSGGP